MRTFYPISPSRRFQRAIREVECGYAYRKKPVILFRTDFRASYELGGARPQIEEKSRAPYNLMLAESATTRLDLPFKAVDSVAESVDQVLIKYCKIFRPNNAISLCYGRAGRDHRTPRFVVSEPSAGSRRQMTTR
jgi:hypothetical protein